MKLELPKSNRQSSIVCYLTSVFCILSSVSFFGFLSSAVCPLSSVFMQNKPNFMKSQININSFITSKYAKVDTWLSRKTNPIQTQLKPIMAKTKPIQIYPRMSQSGTQFLNSSVILSCPGTKRPDSREILGDKFLPYFGKNLSNLFDVCLWTGYISSFRGSQY